MQIIKDEWTPFFQQLAAKVSEAGRTELLGNIINDVKTVTIANFGDSGIARPHEWQILNERYAKKYHDGDRTPTLVLSGELVGSFQTEVTPTFATLTNPTEYADEHLGSWAPNKTKKLPDRTYYPVTDDGSTLTPSMEERVEGLLNAHFSF